VCFGRFFRKNHGLDHRGDTLSLRSAYSCANAMETTGPGPNPAAHYINLPRKRFFAKTRFHNGEACIWFAVKFVIDSGACVWSVASSCWS
jgi:hypothetical protein